MSYWYINFIGFRALKHLGLEPRTESHSSKSWAPELYHCICLVLVYQGSQTPPLSYYLTFTAEQRCLNPRNKTHPTLGTALACVFSHVCDPPITLVTVCRTGIEHSTTKQKVQIQEGTDLAF